jgi:hypothetical protein
LKHKLRGKTKKQNGLAFGVRRQVAAFPLADMSASYKARTCPRTPKKGLALFAGFTGVHSLHPASMSAHAKLRPPGESARRKMKIFGIMPFTNYQGRDGTLRCPRPRNSGRNACGRSHDLSNSLRRSAARTAQRAIPTILKGDAASAASPPPEKFVKNIIQKIFFTPLPAIPAAKIYM